MARFPAKLLLLGEHTVLHGGAAYALPLRRYTAAIGLPEEIPPDPDSGRSRPRLDFAAWAAFAKTRIHAAAPAETLTAQLDLDRWTSEAPGLRVDSDIPVGYGLGSSGALTAALVARYGRPAGADAPLESTLPPLLALLEAYFHGRSSGLDPLVSYLGRGVTVAPSGDFAASAAPSLLPRAAAGGDAWFLLDSGRPRAGRDTIARFGESCERAPWRTDVLTPMLALVGDLIAEHQRSGTLDVPALRELSALQARHLGFLIPAEVAHAWSVLAQAGLAYLKVCGAGGGGYFLGYAPDRARVLAETSPLRDYPITWLDDLDGA